MKPSPACGRNQIKSLSYCNPSSSLRAAQNVNLGKKSSHGLNTDKTRIKKPSSVSVFGPCLIRG